MKDRRTSTENKLASPLSAAAPPGSAGDPGLRPALTEVPGDLDRRNSTVNKLASPLSAAPPPGSAGDPGLRPALTEVPGDL